MQLHFGMPRLLFIALLGVALCGRCCRARCNECFSASTVACISVRQFQFCDGNRTIGPVNACPVGSYCTGQSSICQRDAALKACDSCGVCNELGTFACTGLRTFALCLGTARPSNITATCSPGLVCNRELPEICGAAAVTSASCPEQTATTEPAATTPDTSTSFSADAFCRDSFKGIPIHAIPNDTQCTSYIYCRFYIDAWMGRIIDCPTTKPHFDGRTLCCGTTKASQPGCLQG